jgi:hypothetical protein
MATKLRSLLSSLFANGKAVTPPSAQAQTVAEPKLPADFPDDIPIYLNATVKSFDPIIPGKPELGRMLVLETPHAKESVLALYNDRLAAKGWIIQKTYSASPDEFQAVLGKRYISVAITESHAGSKRVTSIVIGIMPPK